MSILKTINDGCTVDAFKQLLERDKESDKKYTQTEWSESLFAIIKNNRVDLLPLLKEFSCTEHELYLNKSYTQSATTLMYPLAYAIENQASEIMQKLIELGASVHVLGEHSFRGISEFASLLHLAALKGNVPIIKILLAHGVKRHGHEYYFKRMDRAFTLAVESGNTDAFIEAVDGILTEEEVLEVLCKYCEETDEDTPQELFIEDLLVKNKIKIQTNNKLRHHFKETKETKEERQTLLSAKNYTDFITKFPPEEIWRLFVDGTKQRWYDLAFMSEMKEEPQENMLYLSEDGKQYLIPSTDPLSLPPKTGSLSDLSDLQEYLCNPKTVQGMHTAEILSTNPNVLENLENLFERWKQDPRQDVGLKKLILGIAYARGQITTNHLQSSCFFTNVWDKEENGWSGYESREPGCITTMYTAFDMACRGKQELSSDFVIEIHKQAMAHTGKFNNEFDTKADYPLQPGKNLSLAGYLELLEAPYSNWNRFQTNLSTWELTVKKKNARPEDLIQVIEEYNISQKATDPTNREQILKNIILLSSKYARLHPRADGNLRTATLLLNSELIKHGFMPVILEDPNRLEGFSQNELLEEVYQGWRNLKYVIEHRSYPGGKSTGQCKASISNPKITNIPDALAVSFATLVPTFHTMLHNSFPEHQLSTESLRM